MRTLGVVRGITVRSPHIADELFGSIKSSFGGEVREFTQVCEAARDQAFMNMLSHARQLGANAVVGVNYDTSPMANATEVLCYGTAVWIERL